MWQQEVTNYHDETYYLFNDALNSYMAHLQKIHNRGMIESWIQQKTISKLSPWSTEKTMAYFNNLPTPNNETELELYMAGFNSAKLNQESLNDHGDGSSSSVEGKAKNNLLAKFEFEPQLYEMVA